MSVEELKGQKYKNILLKKQKLENGNKLVNNNQNFDITS